MAKQPQTQTEEPKKKSKVKLILIFVIIFVVLLGAAGAFWFFNMRVPAEPAATAPAGEAVGQTAEPTQAAQGEGLSPVVDTPRTPVSVVPLSAFNVNLRDAATDRYLRLGLEVEVSNPEAVQEIEQNQARIRDALIILLSSKTTDELATAEGKMQLKNEIAARINQILGTPRVIRIYFTDFVIT